jgi:hypothetical protein
MARVEYPFETKARADHVIYDLEIVRASLAEFGVTV